METTFRPVSKRRLAELQGYVAWSTSAFRLGGFVAVVAVTTWISHAASARVTFTSASSSMKDGRQWTI
jgi:hypothetical protein